MGVWSVLLAIAITVLRINSAPTNTYFVTNNLDAISKETGLTAFNMGNGIFLKVEQITKSNSFPIAVKNENFILKLKIPDLVQQCFFTVTVTSPKTGFSISARIQLEVRNEIGLAFYAAPNMPPVFLDVFDDNLVQLIITSNGKIGVVGTSDRMVSFAAYDYMLSYDATHKYFMIKLNTESFPTYSELSFDKDAFYLTRDPTVAAISSTLPPAKDESRSPKSGDEEIHETESPSVATASFWKSKWWVIVICVVVLLLLIGAAVIGGIFGTKKIKSRMTEKSKSKGPVAGPTEDSDALSNMPPTTVQPYIKPSDADTVYENKSKKQNTTRQSVRTETTEQKDTTVEPDTTTQTQTSVTTKTVGATKVTDVPAAPAAKPDPKVQPIAGSADPNYQTLATVNGTNKAPAVTMPKEAPKKTDPNYQRIDGLSDESIMKSKKAGKTPAANTTKATPKKLDGNYQTLASLKGPKLSADSTGDKAPSQKADKTASKKQKRMFFKRTTGTDDYPDTDQEKAPSTKTDK